MANLRTKTRCSLSNYYFAKYRNSHKANVACKNAIETAVSDHYANNSLSKEGAKSVLSEFGSDRTLFVLAVTVQHKDWDGRISRDNKAWAKSQPVTPDTDLWGNDRNVYLLVDKAHPGLVDLFVNQVRREVKEQEKRPSVLDKLQKATATTIKAPTPSKSRDMEL